MVEGFLDSSRGIFAGGAKGIAFFEGQKLRSLLANDPLAIRNISGMLEALNGDMWLNGEEGVALLSAGEVQRRLLNLGVHHAGALSI